MYNAVVLASGFSRRLGHNKLLIPLGEMPLIGHTFSLIKQFSFTRVVVVSSYQPILTLANEQGFLPIFNHQPQLGQSQSVILGVKHCNPNASIMFFVGDQPFLSSEVVHTLLNCAKENPNKIIIPTHHSKRANPVIFPKDLQDNLLALTGDIGGRSIIRENPQLVKEINFEDSYSFFDIDTPEDIIKAKDIFYSKNL